MRHLRTSFHPATPHEFVLKNQSNMITRIAARAIVLRGDDILMMYTERYHDYTLPGGGIDAGESIEQGFIRELQEETGAQAISEIKAFGLYEEYRPWQRDGYQVMKMLSHCFTCRIDTKLGATRLESYEINNGMKPLWININQAIEHNLETIKKSDKKGLSIERETFLLTLIKQELLTNVA